MAIKSFCEVSYFDYAEQIAQQIKREIDSKDKEYILGVVEDDYKKFLAEKYSLEPLKIDFENESMGEPRTSKESRIDHWRESYEMDVYTFTVTHTFTGSPEAFRIQPSTHQMTTTPINVDYEGKVSYSFKIDKLDPQEFQRAKNEYHHKAFCNVDYVNTDIQRFNSEVKNLVNSNFSRVKEKFLKENNFFEAIKLNVNKTSVFAAPTVQKKIIPQPVIPKGKEFSSEPTIAKDIYEDILSVIYTSGKNMEAKPSLYEKKDEEGLRDQFLFVLESRYEGTTATGEAFNRGGKTDIMLKYAKDSTNLFVAECKIWHGASEFQNAISQLFDRYLTWRDSKTALLLFVQNKDFTNVLNTIREEAKKHTYFVKENGTRGDSSFSYLFRLPQDQNKHVFFEIMAFHYDK